MVEPCDIISENYNVDKETSVSYELRSSAPDQKLNYKPVNGGLYRGKQSNEPWMTIHVTPTATNLIMNNLKSANPPPGAQEQFIGTNRLGNNYSAKPDIKWYSKTNMTNWGPYNIMGPS